MATPIQSRMIAITLGLMMIGAVVVAVSGYQIPGRVLSTNNGNTNTTPMTYPFTGKVSQEDITKKQVRITTKYGDIVFALDNAEQAPLATQSFVYLAKQKYFDGITWHRVVDHFVIQAGDPTGTGSGGPGYQFADEPVTQEYTAGTVAMANANKPELGIRDTNGSQFFIVKEDQPTLPKDYTIFGHVTSGMDVVQKIKQGDKIEKVVVQDLGTK